MFDVGKSMFVVGLCCFVCCGGVCVVLFKL